MRIKWTQRFTKNLEKFVQSVTTNMCFELDKGQDSDTESKNILAKAHYKKSI